jgi:hypothetical protein
MFFINILIEQISHLISLIFCFNKSGRDGGFDRAERRVGSRQSPGRNRSAQNGRDLQGKQKQV